MKTRNGFVSNSSSSSFIILLPDGFDIETQINWKKLVDDVFDNGDDDFDEETGDVDKYKKELLKTVKKEMRNFIKNGYVGDYDEDRGKLGPYDIEHALSKYVVLRVESGPDGGSSAVLLDSNKVKKILGV